MGQREDGPWGALTGEVIGCVIQVHGTLGPGFLESVYRKALLVEFACRRIAVEAEKEVTILYRGEVVGRHRLDFLVGGRVVVETKTVEKLGPAHYAQVRSYLRAAEVATGLLVNFATERADIRRIESW